MNRTIPMLLALALGCGHSHESGGGDHDDHGAHADGELPAQAVTIWTDKSELFMEYDPFIVGTESRFLAHVTVLDGFKALSEGDVTVTVAMKGGAPLAATAKGPTRPGIFIPAVTPSSAGECTLTVEIRSKAVVDRIDAGPCQVFADQASAKNALAEDEEGGTISFLKEQQWVVDFGTATVAARELQAGVRVNAEVRAVPDREARLTASTEGRLVLERPVPILGARVTRGQLLASIQPTASATGNYGALVADVDAARAELTVAEAQRDRLAPLVASDAIPKRRLEEAEAAVKVARARMSAASTRLSGYRASASGSATATAGSFRVRAPIDGTLVQTSATTGQAVHDGDLLFEIIDLDRVWVTGRVFEADLAKVDGATTAWFQVEGRDEVFEISEKTGRLVTIGSVIDAETRTVPVVFEYDNSARVLRIGQFATLTVGTGKSVTALAVPESALLQEGNQWVAYVQVDGEAFARRIVQTGIRSLGWVEVRGGLAAGEHVVTTGAYDVRLAGAAGGAPAHGHSH